MKIKPTKELIQEEQDYLASKASEAKRAGFRFNWISAMGAMSDFRRERRKRREAELKNEK